MSYATWAAQQALREVRQLAGASAPRAPSNPLEEVTLWVDPDEGTGPWSPNNGVLTLDTSSKAPAYKQSLKLTTNPGANARIRQRRELPFNGKYLRARVDIPDLSKVIQLQFVIFTSPTDHWIYTFRKDNGRLVEGVQVFDIHFDWLVGGGVRSTGGTSPTQDAYFGVDIYVNAEAGQVAEANIHYVENVKRKPAMLFMNDEPYLEFTDYVVPLLEERRLPYQIQVRKVTLDDWDATGESAGKASLRDYRRLLLRGCETGIHHNARPVDYPDDEVYQSDGLDAVVKAHALGLLTPGFMASALTGEWGTPDRVYWAADTAGLVRHGNGLASSIRIADAMTMMPPCPQMDPFNIPTREFDHQKTGEDVAAWIGEAIEKQSLLSVFGHGTDDLSPGKTWRTPIGVYQAFFEELDARLFRDEIVPTTASRLVEMTSAERDLNTKIGELSYRPRT